MTVYLLPIGQDRFELYSEPVDDPVASPGGGGGPVRRWAHAATVRWGRVVDGARLATSGGRLARWRDRLICRLAETIAEQRTLWTLGGQGRATLLFSSTMDGVAARAVLDRLLGMAQRHHGLWMAIDLPLLVVSGFFALIPGPNVIAYYLAFRAVGHALAWRGARQSMKRIEWTLQPDERLAALQALLGVPRAARAARVAAIAADLDLPRLSAFFERVAA